MRVLSLVAALLAFSCSSDGSSSSAGTGASGGTSSGGSSTSGGSGGSSATGGSSSGGSSGTGTSGGAAGTGGSAGECTSATDCRMFNDCCACEALAPGEADPSYACPMASCIQSHCDAISAGSEPRCVGGRCVLDVDCDLTSIGCLAPEPQCDPGFVVTAVNTCYGGCVPIEECPEPPKR